jgi:hypothetical protein
MSDREHDEQLDPAWLPPGVMARDEAADLEESELADELEGDEDGDGEEDLFLESYGGDMSAPWEPVPLGAAREFLRANPDARLQLTFPSVYQEDRDRLVKNGLELQGAGLLSKHTVFHLVAPEFGLDVDYESEMETVAAERKEDGGILGQGDALASRIGSSADEEDEQEHRQDLASPDRARFRRQQRETTRTVLVERNEKGEISRLVETPGLVVRDGRDLEQLGQRRLDLQAKRAAAPQPTEADLAEELRVARAEGKDVDELSPALRRLLIHEGRKALDRAELPPKGPTLTKDEVNYGFADTTHQISLGQPLRACGACQHFRAPGTPSEVGACELVQGAIRGVDVCGRFAPKRWAKA